MLPPPDALRLLPVGLGSWADVQAALFGIIEFVGRIAGRSLSALLGRADGEWGAGRSEGEGAGGSGLLCGRSQPHSLSELGHSCQGLVLIAQLENAMRGERNFPLRLSTAVPTGWAHPGTSRLGLSSQQLTGRARTQVQRGCVTAWRPHSPQGCGQSTTTAGHKAGRVHLTCSMCYG